MPSRKYMAYIFVFLLLIVFMFIIRWRYCEEETPLIKEIYQHKIPKKFYAETKLDSIILKHLNFPVEQVREKELIAFLKANNFHVYYVNNNKNINAVHQQNFGCQFPKRPKQIGLVFEKNNNGSFYLESSEIHYRYIFVK